jgi:hypothetical protein
VLDGGYRIVLSVVSAAGRTATAYVPIVVSRTLTAFSAAPAVFSPNGDGRRDAVVFRVELARPTDVTLRLLRGVADAGVVLAVSLAAGEYAHRWDGRIAAARVADASYAAVLGLADGTVARVSLRIDTKPPSLVLRSRAPLRLWLGERARLVVTADGRRRTLAAGPGTVTVPLPRAPRRVHAVAYDEAGNASRPVRFG